MDSDEDGTVTITVTPVNDLPVIAGGLAATVDEDGSFNCTIEVNDIDGDSLTYSVSTPPSPRRRPRFQIRSSGAIHIYSRREFQWHRRLYGVTISDAEASIDAIVSVTVTSVNDAPVAGDDAETVYSNAGPISIKVLLNDEDVDGDTLIVSSVTQPSVGIATTDGPRSLTPQFTVHFPALPIHVHGFGWQRWKCHCNGDRYGHRSVARCGILSGSSIRGIRTTV